ncbi:MAG: hypothetical protein M1818_004526 [Claussenomyces sp. TS43310]|nr:MAG: hypothetical protein M1818_004526 [Claussenomyces sp. TS43310]
MPTSGESYMLVFPGSVDSVIRWTLVDGLVIIEIVVEHKGLICDCCCSRSCVVDCQLELFA